MELPFKFVAHRGAVGVAFKCYNVVLLECTEDTSEKDLSTFMYNYYEKSKDSNTPVTVSLPTPLQVRVGKPVLSLEEICKGHRQKNYVWYDEFTDNLCTFDYVREGCKPFVCVLDQSRVPAWLKSGCYVAKYCVDGPKECWVRDQLKDEKYFVSTSGPQASIVVTLEKWVKPLSGAASDLHMPERLARERAALQYSVGPFPKTFREFVESFRTTFNI